MTWRQAVWSDAVAQYFQEAYGIVLGERHPTYGSALMREHVQGHHSHIGDVLLLSEVCVYGCSSLPLTTVLEPTVRADSHPTSSE